MDQTVTCICNSIDCATIINSIATVLAVFTSIFVPNLIAAKQNKIALYEKRLDCYQRFISLKWFWGYLLEQDFTKAETGKNPIKHCQTEYFKIHDYIPSKAYDEGRVEKLWDCMGEDEKMFLSLKFLIPEHNEEAIKMVQESLSSFVKALYCEKGNIEKVGKKSLEFTKNFEMIKDYDEKLSKQLMLYR